MEPTLALIHIKVGYLFNISIGILVVSLITLIINIWMIVEFKWLRPVADKQFIEDLKTKRNRKTK